MGQLVSIQKRMNYLKKRKQTYEQQILTLNAKMRQYKQDYIELKKTYEDYEFQTYEEIMEEIQNIMQSKDY